MRRWASTLVSVSFLILLGGCSPSLTEEQVLSDAEGIAGRRFGYGTIGGDARVSFNDGWSDGVDVTVTFDGTCVRQPTLQVSVEPCTGGRVVLEIAYQLTEGRWEPMSSSIRPAQ
jgi:hypothetical protein